jgi:hypothetical protein
MTSMCIVGFDQHGFVIVAFAHAGLPGHSSQSSKPWRLLQGASSRRPCSMVRACVKTTQTETTVSSSLRANINLEEHQFVAEREKGAENVKKEALIIRK